MRTLALCGNSVALSSIAASLEKRMGMHILPAEQIGTVQPEIVVFDLRTAPLDSIAACCREQPQPLFIGFDTAEGGALVISGHASRVSTMEDLLRAIESQTHMGEPAA